MVSLGASGYAIPSVLFLRDDRTFLVGEGAEMRATADPTRVARHFKRQLGDSGSRFLAGTPYSPQTLTARLLTHVLDTVIDRQGSEPSTVVLTHPANWGPYRREVLEQAAAMAGVTGRIQMVSEPEAAASHYAMSERIDTDELIGVYDLGGGTFDAVIMRRTADGFEVVGQPQGVERLGGVDFDDVIWAFVAEAADLDANEMANTDDEAVLAAGHALRTNCVSAKRLLSADTSADIRVALPTLNRTVRLNRKEFENRIRPRLLETITALEAAMVSGNVEAADLSRILLVGGSSRIPIVNQLLAQHFGRPIAVDSDPKNTVALGAALRGVLDQDLGNTGLTNTALDDPPAPATPPTPTQGARQPAFAPTPQREKPAAAKTPPTPPSPQTTPPVPTPTAAPPPSPPVPEPEPIRSSVLPDIDLSSIPTPPEGVGPLIDLTDTPPTPSVPQRLVGGAPQAFAAPPTKAPDPIAPQRPTAPAPAADPHVAATPPTPPATAPRNPEPTTPIESKPPSELDSLQAESRHRVSMPTGPRKENPYQPVDPKQVGDLTSTGGPSPTLIAVSVLLVIVIVAAVAYRLLA